MNAKIKIFLINFTPIGNKTLEGFCFSVKCQTTKKVLKSPVINDRFNIFKPNSPHFWELELYQSQQVIVLQMIEIEERPKIVKVISQVRLLTKQENKDEEQVTFYMGQSRIGVLTYKIQQQKQVKNYQKNSKVDLEKKEDIQTIQKHKMKLKSNSQQSEGSQNERYHVQFTPYQTKNNSMIKLVQNEDHSSSNIFNDVNESSILQRQPFYMDHSLQLSQQIQSNFNRSTQPSSLQKWIKKLQKFQQEKQNQTQKVPLYECIIPEKFQNQKKPNTITLYLNNLTLDSMIDETYTLKSLQLKILGDQNQNLDESLFECSFSCSNENQNESPTKQMKFKNLVTEIPQDKNIQISIFLENLDESQCEKIKISGLFIKEKCFQSNRIPLFSQDEKTFASLNYVSKKIQHASVQCLSSLPSLEQIAVLNKNSDPPQQKLPLGGINLMRQRKLNKILRREILTDFNIKKQQFGKKQSQQTTLNTGIMSEVQDLTFDGKRSTFSIKKKNSFFSNQLKRSNTDDNGSAQYGSQADNKNNRPQSIKRLKNQVFRMNEDISRFKGNNSLQISPSKNHNKHRLRLMSTELADLRQEDSEYQEEYSRQQNFRTSDKAESTFAVDSPILSPKKKIKSKKVATQPEIIHSDRYDDQTVSPKMLNDFIIEINGITVVLYQHKQTQEEGNGKFIIMKSQEGQTFITDTLFQNHLNLNWKNKFYRFTGSKIQIGLYQKTGYSSQCQNKYMGKVAVKLVHLMKDIKQNFYRAQLFLKDKPIGIVILIYDIFIEKNSTANLQRRNTSQLNIKNFTSKITRNTNQTEYLKQNIVKGSEKSTIKAQYKSKTRKRAKTLESNHIKTSLLPAIDRANSPSRRRPSYYQGGKNITIGRAGRFLSSNMAQVVGQM